MYQEFETKEDIIIFALGVMCMDLKTELEGLGEDERSDYNGKLCKMSVDELCKEADWLYYLSGK